MDPTPVNPAGYKGKRLLDVVLSLMMLVLLCPVMAVTGLWIRVALGKPVLFRQRRSGHRGHSFELLKFRTMHDERDASGRLLPDAERITVSGRLLRRLSLDELPQLINVLRGEMSLIGPRPLLEKYDPHYREVERRRFQVRPGITGLAQVSGRNLLSWDERLALDVQYVDAISLRNDLRILGATVAKVFSGTGQSVDSYAVEMDLDAERASMNATGRPG